MKTSVWRAGICIVALAGAPRVTAGAASIHIKGFLCDSAAHAIVFAEALAKGDGVEMARARVARIAAPDSCGLYVGSAMIESRMVRLQGGIAYKLTAYRFAEDGRQAWRAETTFAPAPSEWDL